MPPSDEDQTQGLTRQRTIMRLAHSRLILSLQTLDASAGGDIIGADAIRAQILKNAMALCDAFIGRMQHAGCSSRGARPLPRSDAPRHAIRQEVLSVSPIGRDDLA